MYYTIDPYYSNAFYNECKEALKNNSVEYSEFLSIKTPYEWYLKLDNAPQMVNYDEVPKGNVRWLVSVVKPLRPNEVYNLTRRENDSGKRALAKFIENKPLKEARLSDYAVFFTVKNREELETISREYPDKIWYFGKYYDNKYRVCLATHEAVENFLRADQILLKKTKEMDEIGRFESYLNWRVFRNNDYLLKYVETPYFFKGKYNRVKIMDAENKSRLVI